jgi:3-oxoacyl-[acyl-carrier-protein] synthase-3
MSDIGIEAIEYVLPKTRISLDELEEQGRIISEKSALAGMGFAAALISDLPAHQLAYQAARKLLDSTGIDPEEVGLFVNACAFPVSSLANGYRDWGGDWGGKHAALRLLTYSGCRLQHELGLANARAVGIGEMASMCLLGAVHCAQAMMELDDIDVALCVEADVFPPNCNRELVYNIMSDGACAVLLRRGNKKNTLAGYNQITKGFYWDPQARENEMVSAYFVTARRAIEGGLEKAGLTLADIDLLIPANISKKSWNVLAGMLEIPMDKVYLESVTRQAHSVASDNYINFKDILAQGRLKSGQHVLLYSFGVGAHWGCQFIRI